jgi:hypothetical protein
MNVPNEGVLSTENNISLAIAFIEVRVEIAYFLDLKGG